MKRFYKDAAVHDSAAGFEIRLDGKPVRTPAGALLLMKGEALAQAIELEWNAQEKEILPATMPLMQFAATNIDRVSGQRTAMEEQVLKYLDTDLLCYRAAQPPELAKKQEEAWDPWLSWFEGRFGSRLSVTTDLKALAQPEETHETVYKFLEKLDGERFTILQHVTAASGSLVLALAFAEGRAGAQDVFNAAHVEERHKAAIYNEDFYGPDPAQDKKNKAMLADLQAAEQYISLLGNEEDLPERTQDA